MGRRNVLVQHDRVHRLTRKLTVRPVSLPYIATMPTHAPALDPLGN